MPPKDTSLNTRMAEAIKTSFSRFIDAPTKEHYRQFSDDIGELAEIDTPITNRVKEEIDRALIATFTKDIEHRARLLASCKEHIFRELDTL